MTPHMVQIAIQRNVHSHLSDGPDPSLSALPVVQFLKKTLLIKAKRARHSKIMVLHLGAGT